MIRNVNRSVTPPPLTINTTITKNFSLYLKTGEFPIFNETGRMNCPPAPPPRTKEVRMCGNHVWQIVSKTEPIVKCGYCQNKN